MYKNDMTQNGACADSLLRKLISGGGSYPSCPLPENSASRRDMCENEAQAARTWGLSEYPLASVYAPLQEFENIYDLEAALNNGTIFLDLNLPFEGKTAKGGCCRA